MKYIVMVLGLTAGGILPAAAQTFGVSYTTEVQYAPTLGKTNWCNLLRMDWTLPAFRSGEFSVASVHIYKIRPQRIVDDMMTFSNIEEQSTPGAIALMGYTQKIGRSTLFFGVRNVNEDYFTSPSTSLFTNSSCGIYPTISTNYPIANYPLSGLCLDYKGQFGRWGVKGSLYNGIGYNGWSREEHPLILNFKQDGVFGITEINYQTNYGNYFCGISLHNRLFLCDAYTEQPDETLSTQSQKQTSLTWWGYAEQQIWTNARHEINLLAQYSQNSSADNFCKLYAGLGATWSYQDGKQHRHDAGVVFFAAQFREQYELTGEITYRYQLSSDLVIQPALHLIKNNAGFNSVLLLRLSYCIGWNLRSKKHL